jgi:hypothetical protein
MYFNGLESSLNNALCEIFTDRTDSVGLIVLHKMNYSSKVDLFKRFSDDFHYGMGANIEGYDELIRELKEAGRLRNLVVHADWENTDDDGYTYVDLKITKSGMTQEYAQFSEDSLRKILEVIFGAHKRLSAYWESREQVFQDWPKNT